MAGGRCVHNSHEQHRDRRGRLARRRLSTSASPSPSDVETPGSAKTTAPPSPSPSDSSSIPVIQVRRNTPVVIDLGNSDSDDEVPVHPPRLWPLHNAPSSGVKRELSTAPASASAKNKVPNKCQEQTSARHTQHVHKRKQPLRAPSKSGAKKACQTNNDKIVQKLGNVKSKAESLGNAIEELRKQMVEAQGVQDPTLEDILDDLKHKKVQLTQLKKHLNLFCRKKAKAANKD